MSEMLDTFKAFILDSEAPTMYITGVAGTGKTTDLAEVIQYCLDINMEVVTCAFTHKAAGILKKKLPEKAVVKTLHSFLKKCPTINGNAVKIAHIDSSTQVDTPISVKVLFVDEFSMVGERDEADINDIQYDEEGILLTKVVYIGDPNQLPPVKDVPAIKPKGKYWVKLTKIYRQANDNPLLDTLIDLNKYINGEKPQPLQEHATFQRNLDIVDLYRKRGGSKILLAYTNARVQSLNAQVQGKDAPDPGDAVFCPTVRTSYTIEGIDKEAYGIIGINGSILEIGSKFKSLETITGIKDVLFYHLLDEDGHVNTRAAVFGHETYLNRSQDLAKEAVEINSTIKKQFDMDPKDWSNQNWRHPLAQERKAAWSQFLAFKSFVHCIDFPHAMTVHKSQGSTYDHVYLDTDDMYKCAKSDFQLYLKLMYVAISRAAEKVYTN